MAVIDLGRLVLRMDQKAGIDVLRRELPDDWIVTVTPKIPVPAVMEMNITSPGFEATKMFPEGADAADVVRYLQRLWHERR